MAMRVKPDTGKVGLTQRYRVTNWSEYDRALVNPGNLTIWFDDASIRDQWTAQLGRRWNLWVVSGERATRNANPAQARRESCVSVSRMSAPSGRWAAPAGRL